MRTMRSRLFATMAVVASGVGHCNFISRGVSSRTNSRTCQFCVRNIAPIISRIHAGKSIIGGSEHDEQFTLAPALAICRESEYRCQSPGKSAALLDQDARDGCGER